MKRLRTLTLLILFAAFTGTAGCGGDEAADDQAMMDDTTGAMSQGPMQDDAMMGGAQGDSLRADLSGAVEVPGPGDPDGSGTAAVSIDANAGEVCYEITVEGIGDPTAAHIHEGAEGESGSPVVNFNIGENGLSGCVQADAATMQAIQSSPSDYYVNVHNSEYGAGAVRGQLE